MFWNYNNYFSTPIPREFQLSPEIEPVTSLYQLALVASTKEGLEEAWLKNEGENITGTHKDRSFRYWISYHCMQGTKEVVLSSSGSSAFAAAYYCQKSGIKLHAFIREDFAKDKIDLLHQYATTIPHLSLTPKKDAFRLAKETGMPYLRSSIDPLAIEGYKTLGFEIAESLKDVEEIFIPTSSGATAAGIYQAFRILGQERKTPMPRLYCVQTTMVHPIAEEFERNFTTETSHPARAIIDRIAHRKKEVINILKATKGGAYVISKEETEKAKKLIAHLNEREPGNESAITAAALLKHRTRHPEWAKARAVCIFTN
ncbi:MAG: PLP-dependent lyase/thiolase [Candidatus Wildermuthbacteria bacterium]|nr:PLP-dependent lyase/thiolase [Candidatus Wildermuthbacteria bacterium]